MSHTTINARAKELYNDHIASSHRNVSHVFGYLMFFQWMAGIIVALTISPRVWSGEMSNLHPHVLAALIIGGTIASLPIVLAITRPTDIITRHVIAASQMLWSALFIHLTGGRIETHFHVFGSLAFLAFYRDWPVFVTATVVVGSDHLIRGILWPQSVYGVLTASPWRSLEHAGWVLFESIFLIYACKTAVKEMWEIAEKRAHLELVNQRFKHKIEEELVLQCELARLNRILESVIENLPSMLSLKNANTMEICRWNQAAERITGIGRDDIIGKADVHHFYTDQAIGSLNQSAWALDDIRPSAVEEHILTKTGEQRTLSTRQIPLMDQEGVPEYVLSISEDITQLQVVQAELTEAAIKAKAASQSKSEFLANMSHEIRTPLNGILSLAELLKDSPLNDEQTEDLADLCECARSLSQLLSSILDFSKIEAGKMAIDDGDIDLRKKATTLESIFQARAAKQDTLVLVHVAESVPSTIISDGTRLKQVLTILLDNALKFTPRNGAVILYVDASGPPETPLQFAVCDTGIGIPIEKQASVFEVFTQADGSITRRFGGTGLGLAIARNLVRLLGGELTLRSDTRIGSAFRFTLPQRVPEGVVHQGASNVGTLGSPVEQRLNGVLSVLVVDDNEVNRTTLSRLLKRKGYGIESASSGIDAVRAANERAFDIILMDIHLGEGIDGIETFTLIRQSTGPSASSPIVAFSAFATKEMQERCLKAGMAGFLPKPLNLALLLETISVLAHPPNACSAAVAVRE